MLRSVLPSLVLVGSLFGLPSILAAQEDDASIPAGIAAPSPLTFDVSAYSARTYGGLFETKALLTEEALVEMWTEKYFNPFAHRILNPFAIPFLGAPVSVWSARMADAEQAAEETAEENRSLEFLRQVGDDRYRETRKVIWNTQVMRFQRLNPDGFEDPSTVRR